MKVEIVRETVAPVKEVVITLSVADARDLNAVLHVNNVWAGAQDAVRRNNLKPTNNVAHFANFLKDQLKDI